MTINERYLTIHEVLEITSVTKNTIHRWVRLGIFPSPIRYPTKRTVRWRQTQVLAFMEQAARETQEA